MVPNPNAVYLDEVIDKAAIVLVKMCSPLEWSPRLQIQILIAGKESSTE